MSPSAIARALAINTFLGWMRPGRNCMPSSEAYENLRVGLDAVITHWQLGNGKNSYFFGVLIKVILIFRQVSSENESGWVEPFNVIQILSEYLKADGRSFFNSLRGYGIHKSVITLKLPEGKRSFFVIWFDFKYN